MRDLETHLRAFANEHKINSKGALSVVLVITRTAVGMAPPFKEEDFLTPKGGQVAGLGGPAVQAILADYGIVRILAEEGGRTSRGSIHIMRAYIEFLNHLSKKGLLPFSSIEEWWINRVREFFATKPFKLKIDLSKSVRDFVRQLINLAFERQKENPGTMVAGAVMEHLVGAKLEIALPKSRIDHKGFSVSDEQTGRKGDFLIGDSAIHVTTAPTEALVRKCLENLSDNLRPVIITTEAGKGGAEALARDSGAGDRIDILEIEQFVATNVFERSLFRGDQRAATAKTLIETYNVIIDKCETDPSLKISLG